MTWQTNYTRKIGTLFFVLILNDVVYNLIYALFYETTKGEPCRTLLGKTPCVPIWHFHRTLDAAVQSMLLFFYMQIGILRHDEHRGDEKEIVTRLSEGLYLQ